MSPSRIDELRRRVQNDPASIAFAQLAEEYRRSGQTDEAVRICREGLTRHPGYLSARVTLGRALLDLAQLDEARGEFEFVVAEAPENLAAVRGLAEIYHRDGQTAEALSYYRRALALARHDPEIEEIVQQLSRQIGVAAAEPAGGLSFEEAHQELLSAAERVPLAPATAPPARNTAEGSTAPFDFDRLVAALGSPSAPPQLEAAVAGQAAPAIELPDVVDLGPNPFAALEAELRAHEPALPEPPAERPWPAPGADPVAWDAAVPAADAGLPDITELPTVALDAFAPAPTPHVEPVEADAPTVVLPAPADAPAAVLAAPIVEDVAAVAVTEPEGASAASDDTSPAPAAKSAPSEDVLGDLESWLNTLHDRSAD